MKNLDGRLIIVCLVISFSFSTSFSEGLCAEGLDGSDVLALSEFLQDTEAVYISINQVVGQGAPEVGAVNVFDASSAEDSPVEINLENPGHQVERIIMDVCDEDDYLSLMRCDITERTEGFLCRASESGDGCCSVMLFSMSGSSVIEEGTGPIFTLQYVVSDEAPTDECRALTTENVEATDTNGFDLQVISSQGAYCFAAEVEPEDPDEDTDDDGVIDELDQCPDTNPSADPDYGSDIIIENCETGVLNDSANGCLMSDLIDQCAENVEKKGKRGIIVFGKYVLCVSHLTNEWKKEGLIQRKEKGAILKCAVRSKVPFIRLPWWK
jgi:hypothetical protein